MKKAALPVALLLACIGLSGCPIYEDDDTLACFDDYDCLGGHVCDYPSGVCVREPSGSAPVCDAPSDCADNETCSKNARCVEGDCSFASVGCVRGFECSPQSGRWQCVAEGSANGGQANAGGGEGGSSMSSNGGAPNTNTGGMPDSSGAGGAG